MIKKTSVIKKSKANLEQQLFHYESLSDNELISIIQNDYNNYRKGGYWLCDCGEKIDYDYVMQNTNKKVILKTACPKCKKLVERFVKPNNEKFDSPEFNELLNRYKNQIKNNCNNFKLEDKDDIYGDMIHRFFIAVMTYNGSSKFFTYLNNLIHRRFEDFERKYSRARRTAVVQCQCCGRWVGAITRIHLINTKHKPVEGFAGHQILHDKIINEYGKEKFYQIKDSGQKKPLKSERWEGNRYNKTQRQIIKSRIMQAYKDMFPNAYLSMGVISIHDKDPVTELEYIEKIADKTNLINTGGFYVKKADGSIFFTAGSIPFEIENMCKSYADYIADALHKKFISIRKRNGFKNSFDQYNLKEMLENIFKFLFFGYSPEDISNICNYDVKEVKFWIKQIKNAKEIKEKLNFN